MHILMRTKPMNEVPIVTLLDYFYYNAATGDLWWIKRAGWRAPVGTIVGSAMSNGYISTQLHGVALLAHRIAWAMHYGSWPRGEIDHKNRVRSDNRIDNLREATRPQNALNSPTPVRNVLGVKGVGKKHNKYLARLWDGTQQKTIVLGRFDTLEEAKRCYDAEVQLRHGEFASP